MEDALTVALGVLTAMLTPAVLISASGTLILSTSNRLSRVVDHVRTVSDQFEQTIDKPSTDPLAVKKRALLFRQLDRLTIRVRLLQQSLSGFYLSIAVFVAASISIGFSSLTSRDYGWISVALGLAGTSCLLYCSVLLLVEARYALSNTYDEMEYLWEMAQHYAPEELRAQWAAEHRLRRLFEQLRKRV